MVIDTVLWHSYLLSRMKDLLPLIISMWVALAEKSRNISTQDNSKGLSRLQNFPRDTCSAEASPTFCLCLIMLPSFLTSHAPSVNPKSPHYQTPYVLISISELAFQET